MPRKLYIQDLIRLTLVRKGQAVAKHPLLRSGVVEAVKASPIEPSQIGTESLWETPRGKEPTRRFYDGRYQ